MRDKNGYTTIQMLVVIGILGIFTLVMIGTTSYSFQDRSGEYYDEKVHLIERQASLYGKTLDNLEKDGVFYITVNDLVTNDYYIPDDNNGNVVDPRNSKSTLNGKKIRLTYIDKDNVKAEVLDD